MTRATRPNRKFTPLATSPALDIRAVPGTVVAPVVAPTTPPLVGDWEPIEGTPPTDPTAPPLYGPDA